MPTVSTASSTRRLKRDYDELRANPVRRWCRLTSAVSLLLWEVASSVVQNLTLRPNLVLFLALGGVPRQVYGCEAYPVTEDLREWHLDLHPTAGPLEGVRFHLVVHFPAPSAEAAQRGSALLQRAPCVYRVFRVCKTLVGVQGVVCVLVGVEVFFFSEPCAASSGVDGVQISSIFWQSAANYFQLYSATYAMTRLCVAQR